MNVVNRARLCAAAACIVATFLTRAGALAGPPFQTDDPEPVDFRHYEIYLAAQYEHDIGSVNASLPLLEINYGAAPNLQLSAGLPLNYARTDEAETPVARALLGAEFGAKLRFVPESAGRPQISVYPQIVFGSGDVPAQFVLPLWAQKSYGPWTAFGGGGYWVNPGPGNRDFWFSGIAITRELRSGATAGAELYHSGPETFGGRDKTAIGLGFIQPVGPLHAVLASVARGTHGDDLFSAYVAYEFRLGPR